MKIDSYTVAMNSQHAAFSSKTTQETLRMWVGDQRPDFEGRASAGHAPTDKQVAISEAGRAAASQLASASPAETQDAAGAQQADGIQAASENALKDPKMRLLISVVEALTGKKIQLLDAGELQAASQDMTEAAEQARQAAEAAPRAGWGLEYDYHEVVQESEQTSFNAQGVVHTADGKTLQFDVSLQMQRSYYHETSVSIRAGDGVRKDPLVINFDGTAAELSGKKFDFDIDADGTAEKISFVGSASGFLALDRNGNGKVDDGAELFGTRSGNGFADLAAYDDDGNGWIDENDAIFAQLRIWTKDAGGGDSLSTLAERGVGALYLGSASTPFDLKDGQNTQHGQILSTGVYLKENGGTGTLQQIDLFV
ncbi:hypothetical protein ACMHYJ_01850 [Castellaniella hirudinis]|uniref:hypothetical protein n=1 Tax=Castellaniella hirudinis TaxID=1144617 RepID=UPI0039C3DB35